MKGYTAKLKKHRLESLQGNANFRFKETGIANKDLLKLFFEQTKPEIVIHLAAQASVRYSMVDPDSYTDRGTIDVTKIAAGTKIDSMVFIAHNVCIEENCAIVKT